MKFLKYPHVCPIQVLIWDIEAQPNRHALLGAAVSHADLVCSKLVLFPNLY